MDVLINKKSPTTKHGQFELFELIIVVGHSYPSTIYQVDPLNHIQAPVASPW
jgi:hypothetical protein